MKIVNQNTRKLFAVVILLSLIGIAVVVRRALFLIPILINGYHLPSASSGRTQEFAKLDDTFAPYPVLTLIHILPALLFIVLGPFQFSKKIRSRHPKLHRRSGRVFLVCGIIVGLSGFIMSFVMPAIGGINQAASTILFSLFFLFSLYKAYKNIRQRKIALHREWMIRAYSIGLAVATIRPIIGIFFATSNFSGLTPYEFFGTGFWIGFVLHLILAEAWIYKTRPAVAAGR